MLSTVNKIVIVSVIFVLTFSTVSFSQEKPNGKDQNKGDKEHHHMEGHMDKHEGMDMQKESVTESSSTVREGEINLAAIDANGDGKVYQDQMCWNVVSDGEGECPQCGMKLKEVSLEEAKKNLEENEFEVK